MKSLEPPDSHHLSAAMGWLGLGSWQEAVLELEKISPKLRRHPVILQAWHEVYAKGKKWDLAAEIAQELVNKEPQQSQFWIWHAYATRRMPGGGIPQAREILEKAIRLLPKAPLIAYNLGCYECQLGNVDAAWQWLEKAFAGASRKDFKALALADKDLEPLWERIKGL